MKDDINRKAEESEPLPDLIKNAYMLLGKDWKATKENWINAGHKIPPENTEQLTPVFDKEKPIRSTSDVRTWWTSKPCEDFSNSHINFTVVDSTWEYLEAKTINDCDAVDSFVKNNHLGFVMLYNYQGVIRRYFPDFIIKLKSGEHLIIETKGQDSEKDKTKRAFLDEWCRAVNQHGGFGKWRWAVSFDPNDLEKLIRDEVMQ